MLKLNYILVNSIKILRNLFIVGHIFLFNQ